MKTAQTKAQRIADMIFEYPERVGRTDWAIDFQDVPEWMHSSETHISHFDNGDDSMSINMYSLDEQIGDWDDTEQAFIYEGYSVTREMLADVISNWHNI